MENAAGFQAMEKSEIANTSGHGKMSVIPAGVDSWNWGAFLLNWIWGIGNNTYIALLMFVPFLNFAMAIVLGVKGSTWAWQNKRWESVEQFQQVQRKWTKWAIIVYLAFFAFMAVVITATVFFTVSAVKSSDIYTLSVSKLQASPEAVAELGTPISAGTPLGSFEVEGNSGQAKFSFSAEGARNKGTVYVEAAKNDGKWAIETIELKADGGDKRIDLDQ